MRNHTIKTQLTRDADIILFSRLNPGYSVNDIKSRFKITRHAAARIKRDKGNNCRKLIRYIIFRIEEKEGVANQV